MSSQPIKDRLSALLWGKSSLAWRLLSNEYFLLNVVLLSTYYFYRQPHVGTQVDVMLPVLKAVRKLGLTPPQLGPLSGSGSSSSSSGDTDEYEDVEDDQQVPQAPGVFADPIHSAEFSTLEMQVAATLALTALARAYRSSSEDALVATLLGYSQVFLLLITALTDTVASAWYLLAFAVIFLLFNEPSYSGESNVEPLTAQTFVEKCAGKETAPPGTTYVVFCSTQWSARCRHAYPLFASLSLRYSTERLRFARLDVGVWPHIARSLKLDLSAASSQLPTVIGFEAGQEYARVPQGSKTTLTGLGKWTFSRVELISGLQLDTKFATTMAAPPQPAATSSAS